ncbi:translocase of chloroplast 120, chloroplastic [Cicer arietinum]|uniref:Translocase of chloroplast 120, chloroplastic n=1 Tax=Cicer arietinum TaxID=3827 RepID=A0A1S2Y9E0_CICAR|nr:translocase of chloroplast 120, chloroplastic [Cicer arietinum]
MDNNAVVFDGYGEGERKRVDFGVSNESKGGSNELKNLEGDEVFEEAIDPLKHFNDLEDTVVGQGDVDATVTALPSTLVDEIPDTAEELDNFEEAIGVADEPAQHSKQEEAEVIANQEVPEDQQGQLYSSSVDGVGTGGTEGGVSGDESYSIRDDCLESSDCSEGKKVSDLNTDGSLVSQEAIGLVNGNSGYSSEKSENEDLEYVTPRQNGGMLFENGRTDKVDYAVAEFHTNSESYEEIGNQGADAGDLKEGGLDPELKDDKVEEQCNGSGDPYCEIQNIQLADEEKAHRHSSSEDLDPHGKIIIEMEDVTLGTDIIHEDKNGKEIETSDSQSTECNDYSNDEANDANAGSDSEHQQTIDEAGGSSLAAEEREAIQTAGSSSLSESSFVNEALNVQATESYSEEQSSKDYPSKISAEENQGNFENLSVVREPKKIPETNVEEKKTNQIIEEQKRELVSSSGKSVATSTPLVHPAGLGPAAPLLEPAPRVVQQPRVNHTVSNTQSRKTEDSSIGEAEEYDETREKLQMIRVKFLRLANRLGQTPHNVVVAQVLYRLGLAEQLRGRNGGRVGAFSFDRASAMAEQLESAGQEPLDFCCTIMVLGKTGVGKSATINSIFDEVKFNTDAFHMGTKKVQDVVGTVQGIKVRVIDTPGLLPSWSDQRHNEKILLSVKRFIKKTPPDIVLYLDRLDMQSRDFSDMPLLRTITDIFGPSIWFNAIVVLTHAASAPPDGPNGTASSYDMFVTQRSHVVQQAIRQAAGDMRLMNPVSLVENHSACRINRAGQRVLPNGQVWKPHLLLLSFASKILAEANALLKLQDSPPEKPYTARTRMPPLPFLLSSLLQSRPQLKLPEEQFSDDDILDGDLDEPSDSDDETDPDDLPPFKPLTKAEIRNLSRAQKKAYMDEVEYREKLFMKKQLKYEKKQRKMMKEMAESAKDLPNDYSENVEEETGGAASVPVPMPDLALPSSFDSDTPTHRYRYLDSSNQWLVRPVLETHGWDHDVGYEGLNVERLFVVKDKIPLSFSGQVTKDKKDANIQMELASSVKYGEGKATSVGFDMQTAGKDLAYTLRSETKFCNFRRNKATAGLSFTLLGDALSAGVKFEDKLIANKQFKLVIAGGAMTGRDDVAYGGSLEAHLRDKNYPLGRSLSTLGLSVMDWHGDLAIGCNLQSQIPIGRYTNLVARANLNNRGAGQISIRLNSSEQLQIALIGLIPLLKKAVGYSQQLQFGQ